MSETPDPKPKPDEEPPQRATAGQPAEGETPAGDAPYSSDEEAEVAARLESLGYM
jgi:hypothetical protein